MFTQLITQLRTHGIEAQSHSLGLVIRANNAPVALVVIPDGTTPTWSRYHDCMKPGLPVFKVAATELDAFAASWNQRSVRQLSRWRLALKGYATPPI